MTSHMPCLTGFHGPSHVHVHRQASTFSMCVGTKDRSCVKRSKAWQPRATEPNRLSISMSSAESLPHRKRSSSPCCPSIAEPSFCRPSRCRTRKISKLIYWESCRVPALWLARRIIKATASSRFFFCRPRPTRAYVWKLKFTSRDFGVPFVAEIWECQWWKHVTLRLSSLMKFHRFLHNFNDAVYSQFNNIHIKFTTLLYVTKDMLNKKRSIDDFLTFYRLHTFVYLIKHSHM